MYLICGFIKKSRYFPYISLYKGSYRRSRDAPGTLTAWRRHLRNARLFFLRVGLSRSFLAELLALQKILGYRVGHQLYPMPR